MYAVWSRATGVDGRPPNLLAAALVVIQSSADVDLQLGQDVDLVLPVKRVDLVVDESSGVRPCRYRAGGCVSSIVVMSIGAIVSHQ